MSEAIRLEEAVIYFSVLEEVVCASVWIFFFFFFNFKKLDTSKKRTYFHIGNRHGCEAKTQSCYSSHFTTVFYKLSEKHLGYKQMIRSHPEITLPSIRKKNKQSVSGEAYE